MASQNVTEQVTQNKLQEVLKELPEISDHDLQSAVGSTLSKLSGRRLGGLVDRAKLKPLISVKENLLVLPATYSRADNSILHYMLSVAKKLKYKVKAIDYGSKPLRELSEHQQKVNLGIYMSLDDTGAKIRMAKKKDPYEIGRTYVRSQQIIGCIGSEERLGVNVLIENNRLFGNSKSKDNSKIIGAADQYWVRELPSFFEEGEWAQELATVFLSLVKQSWTLLQKDVMFDNIIPYIETYNSFIAKTQAVDIITTPAKGRKKAETTTKVPSKPKRNPLLLDGELKLLLELSASIWEPTPFESLSQEAWATKVLDHGLTALKSELNKIYSKRGQFLSKMAALTTKRLQLLRNVSEQHKTIRKADVSAQNLEDLLSSYDNPEIVFSQEIIAMDPTGSLFLKEWQLGHYIPSWVADHSAPAMERIQIAVQNAVTKKGFYDAMANKLTERKDKILAARKQIESKAATEKQWRDDFIQKYGAESLKRFSNNIYRDSDGLPAMFRVDSEYKRKAPATIHIKEVPHAHHKPTGKPSTKGKSRMVEVPVFIDPLRTDDPPHGFDIATDEQRGLFYLERLHNLEGKADKNQPEFRAAIATYKQYGKLPSKYDYLLPKFRRINLYRDHEWETLFEEVTGEKPVAALGF